jgi:hypothetical protein
MSDERRVNEEMKKIMIFLVVWLAGSAKLGTSEMKHPRRCGWNEKRILPKTRQRRSPKIFQIVRSRILYLLFDS